MKRVELIQGSREWWQWRRWKITGSRAPAVMNVSPSLTAGELLLEMLGDRPREEDTFAMRRGRRLEPIARAAYVERLGFAVEPLCVEHDSVAWMAASLDGWWNGIVIEIKCPKWTDHELAIEGIVPRHFRPQLTHNQFVTDAQVCHYVSFNDGQRFGEHNQLAIVPYTPTDEEVGALIEAEELFWQRLSERRSEKTTVKGGVR